MKIILSVSILLACIISAKAQSTVSFDNQSGEPALVKLIGPTTTEVQAPDSSKQIVQALVGKYYIKVRYGVQGKYHYTKGQEFTVDETATTTSDITITLHKVVNGNYDSSPINELEFGVADPAAKAASQPAAAKPAGPLVIRKAVYGEIPDGPKVEVTDKVRAMVKNGMLSVVATDDNFGDPYNGTMKLTIIKAEASGSGLNMGSSFTDIIKGYQRGNSLMTRITGFGKVTVYYKYGDREALSTSSSDDGLLIINPPTKLRVDYTVNGVDATKTADLSDALEINEKGK
jgi:hypothetical protein